MFTKVVFDSPVSNSSVEEILRAMPKYKDDLEAMCKKYGYHEVVDAIYHDETGLCANVDWDYIEELLNDYLWNELASELIFEPVQEALSNPERVFPELESNDALSFWLGSNSDIHKVLVDVINAEAEGENGARIVEERIRHRLKSEPDFFNEVVYGGTCDEDLDYILRCIHENAQNLPEEEWKEEYSHWTYLTTVEQVADDYYGYDALICLIPEWYCDEIHFRLMEEYDDALQKSGNEISRSVNLHS